MDPRAAADPKSATGRGKDYAIGESCTTRMSKKALALVVVVAAVLLYAKKR
jgi:hypothetical protein